MNQIFLSHSDIELRARAVAKRINEHFDATELTCYAIPRGGIPAAYALQTALLELEVNLTISTSHVNADFLFDDIVDSGATMKRHLADHGGPFFALVDKVNDERDAKLGWVVFPWEGTAAKSIEDNIVRLLQYVGEDPKRGGLLETPGRVARAWKEWTRGYSQNPASILKAFADGAEKCDELVVVKNIPIYSHCEHHLAAIFGTATIGYIPNGRIVGLSKLSRLADAFARRLQVQERLTNQIADALDQHLQPKAVGVIIKARHLCMESRGVCQQGHHTITSAVRGAMRTSPEVRAEFMALAKE